VVGWNRAGIDARLVLERPATLVPYLLERLWRLPVDTLSSFAGSFWGTGLRQDRLRGMGLRVLLCSGGGDRRGRLALLRIKARNTQNAEHCDHKRLIELLHVCFSLRLPSGGNTLD
jgi:hypothetical protein